MKRRQFLEKGAITAAIALTPSLAFGVSQPKKAEKPFNMKFSPEFGLFSDVAGNDALDQIRWGYDQGFRAWENTFLKDRSTEEQEAISKLIQKLGMEFGQFVGTMTFSKVTFAGRDENLREKVLDDVRTSIEIAKRMNTKVVHIVLGRSEPGLPMNFQMANAIELLKRIAEIYEPHGITAIIEPMNHKTDHAGMFLHSVPQAYALSKAVDGDTIKILFDIYHVQIQEGNLISSLDYAWDKVGYLQIGDNPGRNEPTSGEINYKNVLQHIHDKGYRGFAGLEHSTSKKGKEGEWATIEAYRSVDPK